jgi:Fur family transcriptional regulator, ferric uptake regulator
MKLPSRSAFAPLEAAIRATGARVTSSRVRVLNLLRSAQGALRHGDIEEALARESLPRIDRVTLYRVLDWLSDNGLAHKAADAHGVFRFSAAAPNAEHGRHVHFRCTECGGVRCLDMEVPKPPSLPKGFRLTGMELDIRGECAGCARRHM